MNNFLVLLKWARKFRKVYARNATRHTWDGIEHRINFLRECEGCGNSGILSTPFTRQRIGRKDGLFCRNCHVCVSCCDCVRCRRCETHKRVEDSCAACMSCNKCCRCISCQNCGDYCKDAYCEPCRRCEGCCSCGNRVNFFQQSPKFHMASRVEHKLNPTNRYIAAEIEVAGVIEDISSSLDTLINNWGGSIVYDGSLPKNGFEINTSPARGDLFVKQINEISGLLEKGRAKINDKCGLHVHVDARDLNFYDMRRLINTYAAIEKGLFAMVPPDRYKSHFCIPCGDRYLSRITQGRMPYKDVKKNVIQAVYNSASTQDMRNDKYNPARYYAMNMHSLFYRGTIECRLFNGTIEADKIIRWGILWAMIIDYVQQADDEKIAAEMSREKPIESLLTIAQSAPFIQEFIQSCCDKYNKR